MFSKVLKGDTTRPIRIEAEDAEGRVFISVGGMIVDVHCNDDGVSVQITHGNEVLDEAGADYPDEVNHRTKSGGVA